MVGHLRAFVDHQLQDSGNSYISASTFSRFVTSKLFLDDPRGNASYFAYLVAWLGCINTHSVSLSTFQDEIGSSCGSKQFGYFDPSIKWAISPEFIGDANVGPLCGVHMRPFWCNAWGPSQLATVDPHPRCFDCVGHAVFVWRAQDCI